MFLMFSNNLALIFFNVIDGYTLIDEIIYVEKKINSIWCTMIVAFKLNFVKKKICTKYSNAIHFALIHTVQLNVEITLKLRANVIKIKIFRMLALSI